MSGEIEKIVEQRQKMLEKLLLGISLVGGSFLLQDAVPITYLHGVQALTLIPMLFGVAIVLTTGRQLNILIRRLSADRQLLQIVNDERVTANELKAAAFALGLLIVINSLAMTIPIFAPHLITVKALAECNWLAAVVASLGGFLYLDRAE